MGDRGLVGSHAFRSLGFDSYRFRRNPGQFGEPAADAIGVRADLRFSKDQGGIHIGDFVTRRFDAPQGFSEKYD